MANKQKLSWFLKAMLFLGLAFLYIPLIVLVVYSFNDSKLVTIWGGFSTKWYAKLLNNDQILEAAWLSLRIAVVSSLAATVLGTLAGYALARIKRFRGSTLFAGMVSAPMVMPDVLIHAAADYPSANHAARHFRKHFFVRQRLFYHFPRPCYPMYGLHYRCHPCPPGRA